MIPCWPLLCHLLAIFAGHHLIGVPHPPIVNLHWRQFPGAEWWWRFPWPTCGPCNP